MKPRAAWPVLAKKAKEKCDEAHANITKARQRVMHLQQSKQRMLMLYDDYVRRSQEAERQVHSMAQTLNFRGFMQQLQSLIARVEEDLLQAQQHLAHMQLALRAAEQKRVQMETLLEQDLKAVRDHARKREQREMDAAGVMLYNLKS